MPATAQPVQVEPVVGDEAIAARLTRIFQAAGWFEHIEVEVDEGIVFIRGRSEGDGHRGWATNVAGHTEGVVAVVNQLQLTPRSMWDFSAAWSTIAGFVREAVHRAPLVIFGILMLVLSWATAVGVGRGMQALLRPHLRNVLLRSVASKIIGSIVFLLGLYLVLRVSGLTRLAVTVLSGTGIIGLVVGFAFRDIAENFLASILMSLQRPFATGDLIQVAGFKGYVQSVNARSSLLMTLDGNHVQIPNATVYKEPITNFSSNPRLRGEFVVGIGFDAAIAHAQRLGLELLRKHEAVVPEPEPLVLAEAFTPLAINLRFFYWIDGRVHSEPKVRSALLRLTKRAFQQAEISMPPGMPMATSVTVPAGWNLPAASTAPVAVAPRAEESESAIAPSEGALVSEAAEINHQARAARSPEGGTNLLEDR